MWEQLQVGTIGVGIETSLLGYRNTGRRSPPEDPPGVMWPSRGFEANQWGPEGEVVAFGNFFQALKRRIRRRRHSQWIPPLVSGRPDRRTG